MAGDARAVPRRIGRASSSWRAQLLAKDLVPVRPGHRQSQRLYLADLMQIWCTASTRRSLESCPPGLSPPGHPLHACRHPWPGQPHPEPLYWVFNRGLPQAPSFQGEGGGSPEEAFSRLTWSSAPPHSPPSASPSRQPQVNVSAGASCVGSLSSRRPVWNS